MRRPGNFPLRAQSLQRFILRKLLNGITKFFAIFAGRTISLFAICWSTRSAPFSGRRWRWAIATAPSHCLLFKEGGQRRIFGAQEFGNCIAIFLLNRLTILICRDDCWIGLRYFAGSLEFFSLFRRESPKSTTPHLATAHAASPSPATAGTSFSLWGTGTARPAACTGRAGCDIGRWSIILSPEGGENTRGRQGRERQSEERAKFHTLDDTPPAG